MSHCSHHPESSFELGEELRASVKESNNLRLLNQEQQHLIEYFQEELNRKDEEIFDLHGKRSYEYSYIYYYIRGLQSPQKSFSREFFQRNIEVRYWSRFKIRYLTLKLSTWMPLVSSLLQFRQKQFVTKGMWKNEILLVKYIHIHIITLFEN